MARALVIGARAPRPLGGSWEIARVAPGGASDPDALDSLNVEWIPCPGPVSVAAALRAAGRWDGAEPRDFDADDWWYRCRFTVPAGDEPVRLRFDGLATVTSVWLNGAHILQSHSMFVEHAVDITQAARSTNTLHIRCAALGPLLTSAPPRPRPRWKTALVQHQALRWFRTSLLGRLRSWCPPVAAVGPWRPITIESSPIQFQHARVDASLDGCDGVVQMRLDVRVSPSGSRRTSIEGGVLRVGAASAPIDCEQVADDVCSLRSEIRLKDPRLWWPHTHGHPYTYDVEATLRADGLEQSIDLGRVGFRTVHVDRGHDNRGFGLVVNGTPIFCRGVCWTPIDLASVSADPASYRIALEQLRDAGMNMVRVAGITAYETDAFYDVCDQLGLLVWQDFMFANMDYPWQDEVFAQAARLEVAQVLETLQSHPSLAVVCGSSEVDQQAAMLGLPLAGVSPATAHPFADLVQAAVPDVIWLPTTPTGGTLPFHVDSGVSHYFGVGAYRRPFDDARRAQVRFAAECLAFSNIPEPGDAQPALDADWKRRVPRDAGADWDFEDVRDYYVEQLFDVRASDVRSGDPDRYVALGRAATGEAMLRTFSEWRRPGSSCRGGLVWFARDLAPGPGWGVMDSTGRRKSVYWYLKRVFAPIALLPADEGLNGLWLHAINDSPGAVEGELRVALYRMGRPCGRPISVPLDVSPRSSRSLHVDGLFDGFRDLTYAYRFGPPQHDVVSMMLVDRSTGIRQAAAWYFPVHLPTAIDMDLQVSAEIESAGDGHAVVLEASRFAQAVAIDIDGFVPEDNYFCLEPGERRRLTLIATDRRRTPEGRVTALNCPRPCAVISREVVDAG